MRRSNDIGERNIKGIAARAGRWSAAHRKLTIAGWLAFVVLAVFAGSAVGQKTLTDADETPGEAGRAERVIVDKGLEGRASESVLLQSKRRSVDDAEFKAAIADVAGRLRKVSAVTRVETPAGRREPGEPRPPLGARRVRDQG